MNQSQNSQLVSAFVKKVIIWSVVGVVGLVVLFGSIVVVESGSRGLLFTMGALNNTVLNEGFHAKMPIVQKVKNVTIRPQQVDYTVEVGQDGAITKDNQTIGAAITIFFKYKPENLVELWRNTGEEKMKSIIVQTVKENFKKAIGSYTIFEIAVNQEKIRAEVFEKTKSGLGSYPVEITELKVTNYDWSDTFEKQIEETMKRAQEVKQKEQELLVAEQEAQKQVKQAEANKQAMITNAEGEKEAAKLRAEAKALEGEGIRKFNESIRATKDIEIQLRQLEIERERVVKWNGQYVPNNNYGPIPVSTGQVQGK
jgi:regulator of protease activity HflC (stomatin/prohibitin superfamily)